MTSPMTCSSVSRCTRCRTCWWRRADRERVGQGGPAHPGHPLPGRLRAG
jgi:hypothetical protein